MLGASSGALAPVLGRFSGCQCFQLTYQSLEGYANLLGRKLEKHVAIADYRLRGCLYDTSGSSKQFIGRCHDSMSCGLVESLQSGAVVCPIEQTAFFHSPQPEPSIIVVIELTASFLSGSEERCVSLGWTMLPAFHHQPRTTQRGKGTRLALYEGSPRALFSLQHPVTDSKDLVPIPGCILTCNLHHHPILSKASHLIPANVLVSFDDVIPGLIPTRVQEAFPKLVRTTSAILEKVSLLLLPSVDNFEEQLLSQLATDLFTNRVGGETNSSATVEERRVKISLYNGWQFTSSPLIGYLEKVSPSTKTSLRHSPGLGLRNNLVLKGSLEISDIIPHPLTEVVLQLEYVVSWSGAAMETGAETTGTGNIRRGSGASKPTAKSSSTHSCPLILAWGVWQPWNSETPPPEKETQVSIDLKSGPGFKPSAIPHSAFKTCYQSGLSDAGKMTLKFISCGSSRIEDSLVSTSMPQFDDPTPSPTLGLRRPSRPVFQEGRDEPDTGEVPQRARRKSEPPVKGPVTSTPARGRDREEVSEDEESLVPADPQPPAVEVGSASCHPSTTSTAVRGSRGVSRSTLAYLHSAGFEELRDTRGNPLPSVEGAGPKPSAILEQDPLKTGPFRVSVQLMAFSFSVSNSPVGEEARVPSSLVLSYQFFQFPRVSVQCQLIREAEGKVLPYLLREGGSGQKPGVMHCYPLSHVTLPTRTDRSSLSHHLWQGSLQVDVSDGDSLILLGTAAVPLRGLFSQERDHFQFTVSSPVAFPVSCLDPSTSTTIHLDSLDGSSSRIIGKLYLKLAKLPADNRNLKQQPQSPVKKSSGQAKLARRLYGYSSGGSADDSGEDEQTKKRKHARMQCVREMRLTADSVLAFNHTHNPPPTSSQMNLIDVQREELKRETIASVLEEALTSSYLLRPRMGQAVYFEHEFKNVHNHPLSVSVSWRDPDLRLMTDRNECHYHRQLNSINTVLDDNLITEASEGGHYGFLVHSGETVRIPFKYQCFSPVERTSSQLEDGSSNTHTLSVGRGASGEKFFKVYLQSPQRDLLGVLKVRVEPQGQPVDHTLHFYHPERSFLKRHLRLRETLYQHQHRSGVLDSDVDPPVLFACSSDPDHFCEIRDMGHSRAVYIKAPVRPAPITHSFYIMVYRQKYAVSPAEVWQVFIHSVHRVDHSLVLGQSSLLKLTLRGNGSTRRVAFYSTSGPVLKVVTPSPLLLTTHSLTELNISLKPRAVGSSDIIITAVDVDSRQLVNAWLVHTTSQEPVISRAFQITLPTGGNSLTQKTITFTNPYSKHKRFTLSTNQPGIIKFNNCSVKLQPQETTAIGLQFSPSVQPLAADVLVFINDDLDQTEECFLVKTVFS